MVRYLPPLRPALAAALLVIAGCAAGPRYRAPDPAASAPAAYWTTAEPLTAAPPPDEWWRELGDPLLDALVAEAIAGNPDLATAEARVQQARALARVAGASFYPAANADARVSRDKLSRNGENLALIPFTPSTTEFTDYRIGFDAAWEIDLAGRTRHEAEAAIARLGGAQESRNDARVVVAAEVADAYVAYRTAAQRRGLAARMVADADAARELVALQTHAGVASVTDQHRAEAERLTAAATVPALDAQARTATLRLAALTGEAPTALEARLGEPRAIPPAPTTAPVGLPADVLRRRPDVRRAERELAAATADVGSAVAAQFPRLSLVGDFGWDSVRSGELARAASRYWNLAPQLTLPLFAGGRLRGQADAARAARDAALGSYRSTVLRALSDTESSMVRFAADRDRFADLDAAASALAASVALEQRRFEAGDASMLEVLAARRTADQAADQRAAEAGQLAQDYIALGKALGGGWRTRP
ncbi:MAG: efflux transporter outer membrane subunit [Proteobacteria bacterium]|nr:efflux transporter outer membrane subunit [Pseudomonadota bacterium]